MHAIRTPDDRFESLPGYPFGPHYVEVRDPDGGTLRMHYLDEGPAGGKVVVLLHGEPSWSYLYRHMIPVLVAAGYRCIAPDLIGFGRSDKPTATEDYTFANHVEWLRELLFDHLDLSNAALFGQDWGGLLGLRLLGEHSDRFARAVIGNSALPTGDEKMTPELAAWQKFARETPTFPVGGVVSSGCVTALSPEVVAAYEAPFPEESYKVGARTFPTLIPTSPDNPASEANRAAWASLAAFDRPFLCTFSDGDPLTAGSDRRMLREIPGTVGQPHVTIEGAGHFLQEDRGIELANVIVSFMEAS